MNTASLGLNEIALWSACVGLYAVYALQYLFLAIYRRDKAAAQTAFFVFSVGCTLFVLSGLSRVWLSHWEAQWHDKALLVIMPMGAAVAIVGLRAFLRAQLKDAWIDKGLLVTAALALAALAAAVLPSRILALEMSGLILVVCGLITSWLCIRAWLLGDSLALPMSIASVSMLFVTFGAFGIALGALAHDFMDQLIVALLASFYVVLTTQTIDRRHRAYLRMKRALASNRDRDLLTQLVTGAALVRNVEAAIVRAKRNKKSMAVICVEIYNMAQLRQEFGSHGADEVLYALAGRLRERAGSDAEVGRYGDSSFIVLLGSVKHASVIRGFGLRVAAAVRRPVTVKPYSLDPRQFRADIGVGVAVISHQRQSRTRAITATEYGGFDGFSNAQDALHEAVELAMMARHLPSRVATMDDRSREPVALESARFD